MGSISISRHIDAPVDRVFAMMSDFPNAARNVQGIEKVEMLTDGPVRAGTRFRETRIMMKKEATEEMTVTEYVPNDHYTLGCESCGCQYATTVSFQPDGGGTLVTMDMQYTPVKLMAKLMSPLGFMMKGIMRKCVEKDLDDVKQRLESDGQTTGQPHLA